VNEEKDESAIRDQEKVGNTDKEEQESEQGKEEEVVVEDSGGPGGTSAPAPNVGGTGPPGASKGTLP
jgi:hypothetical protein